jgi:hypothetical protein
MKNLFLSLAAVAGLALIAPPAQAQYRHYRPYTGYYQPYYGYRPYYSSYAYRSPSYWSWYQQPYGYAPYTYRYWYGAPSYWSWYRQPYYGYAPYPGYGPIQTNPAYNPYLNLLRPGGTVWFAG